MANGFFTDTTLCIGCKACEVACKECNQLPADSFGLSGMSYDNTVQLSATTWRHVTFVEQFDRNGKTTQGEGAGAVAARIQQQPRLLDMVDGGDGGLLGERRWLMMSDVCKHCTNAGCLQACRTGALIRNEFDDVYMQPEICNGCRYCVPACPFGVIDLHQEDGRAWKCTLCYDRQKEGMTPACAKACPMQSILVGDLDELRALAERFALVEAGKRSAADPLAYQEITKGEPGEARPIPAQQARQSGVTERFKPGQVAPDRVGP